jgi:hypothetical protein
MSADEEPHDRVVALTCSRGPIRFCDPHRPERKRSVQRLELQAGMSGVGLESSVGGSRPLLHVPRQLGEIATERRMKARDHKRAPLEPTRIKRLTFAPAVGFQNVVDQPTQLLGASRCRIEPALIFVQPVHQQLNQTLLPLCRQSLQSFDGLFKCLCHCYSNCTTPWRGEKYSLPTGDRARADSAVNPDLSKMPEALLNSRSIETLSLTLCVLCLSRLCAPLRRGAAKTEDFKPGQQSLT